MQVTVQAGLISGAVKANSLERVTIDTTVQEKAVASHGCAPVQQEP